MIIFLPFTVALILSIIGMRIGVLFIPEVDVKIFGRVVHHFWFGVTLVPIAILLFVLNWWVSSILLGIACGLIIDELVFILRGSGRDKQYWAKGSILPVLIVVTVALVLLLVIAFVASEDQLNSLELVNLLSV